MASLRGVGLLTIALIAAAAGCSGSSPGPVSTSTASASNPEVRIVGMITDVYTCEPVGGPKHYQVTVRDGAGTVIGTTATGVPFPEVADRQDNICTWTGSYEVEVPREDFYLFHVEGTDKDPEPISYKDLVAMNFEYDLTLGPA